MITAALSADHSASNSSSPSTSSASSSSSSTSACYSSSSSSSSSSPLPSSSSAAAAAAAAAAPWLPSSIRVQVERFESEVEDELRNEREVGIGEDERRTGGGGPERRACSGKKFVRVMMYLLPFISCASLSSRGGFYPIFDSMLSIAIFVVNLIACLYSILPFIRIRNCFCNLSPFFTITLDICFSLLLLITAALSTVEPSFITCANTRNDNGSVSQSCDPDGGHPYSQFVKVMMIVSVVCTYLSGPFFLTDAWLAWKQTLGEDTVMSTQHQLHNGEEKRERRREETTTWFQPQQLRRQQQQLLPQHQSPVQQWRTHRSDSEDVDTPDGAIMEISTR